MKRLFLIAAFVIGLGTLIALPIAFATAKTLSLQGDSSTDLLIAVLIGFGSAGFATVVLLLSLVAISRITSPRRKA